MTDRETYIAERILRFTAEDEQSGGCTLTKAQAQLIVDELDRLRGQIQNHIELDTSPAK